MDDKLRQLISDSSLSKEDKDHWNLILPKLNEMQKEELLHILQTKIDIRRAKDAIEAAIAIIDEAENEAQQDIKQEEVEQKAHEELKKEIENENPHLPTDSVITKDELTKHHQDNEEKLMELRRELQNISIAAHGSPPPSQIQ